MAQHRSGGISTHIARIGRAVAVVAAFALCGAGTAQAAPVTFSSALGPEVSGATGTGFVTVVYDDLARTLFIETTFSGLSGPSTVAHIHCCTATPFDGTIGVAVTPGTLPGFPEGVTSAAYLVLLDLTAEATYTATFRNNFGGGTIAGAEAALVAGMFAGTAYFNIHSTAFPPGEIRGFLQPVPEPSSLLLLGMALATVALRRRRV